MDVRRHVATLDNRQVHYRRAGTGPVVVLLHQSPRSSLEMVPLMLRLAENFTVIAPDTPGNGMSTPLAIETPTMGDFADALAAFLTEIGIGKALVYGFHTGAMCAFELARRHPGRVACSIVNGYVHPPLQEQNDLLAHYFVSFEPDWSGAHLIWAWARMREQYIFYPWYKKTADARISMPEPTLEMIQADVMDLLRAGKHYRGPYRAAFTIDLETAAGEIEVPTVIMTMKPDWPLRPHLANMAPPSDAVTVSEPETIADAMALLDRALGDHCGNSTVSPPIAPTRAQDCGGWGRFLALSGGDLFMRTWGDATGPGPLVLLHDVGRSSSDMEDIVEQWLENRTVIAFDLPGCGESDRFGGAVTPVEQAAILKEAIGALGITGFDVAGFGTAGPVAIELGRCEPKSVISVYAACPRPGKTWMQPPQAGGFHLMKAWLDQRQDLLFGSDALDEWALSPSQLQQRVVDSLKGEAAAAKIVRAAIDYLFEDGVDALAGAAFFRLPDGDGAKKALSGLLCAGETL